MTTNGNTLTAGQRRALEALKAHAERRGHGHYTELAGVQARTLYKLQELGLAKVKSYTAGPGSRSYYRCTARITVTGCRVLQGRA